MKIVIIPHDTKFLLIFRGQLLNEMIKAGHEVIVCGPGENPDYIKQFSEMGITYISNPLDRTSLNPLKDLYALQSIYRILKQVKPDVVMNIAMKPGIYGSLVAYLARIPHIYSLMTGLGYVVLKSNFKERIINRIVCILFRLVMPKNEIVFFQNPDDLSLFVQSKFIAKNKAVLVNGSGINLDQFQQVPVVDGSPVFLMIARLVRYKGIVEFVDAARSLKQRYPQAVFRLVGGPDSNPTALPQSLINQWHNEGVIEYCGETSDVRPFIRQASVYVLPSYREGTPRTVLEAMAMGRPIVTTDTPGCRETVVDGSNGFLVPTRNAQALAQAMERFILNPDLIKEMGQRSRELAVEKFDIEKVNATMMKEMKLAGQKTI